MPAPEFRGRHVAFGTYVSVMEAKFCSSATDGVKCPHLAILGSDKCKKHEGEPSPSAVVAAKELLKVPQLFMKISNELFKISQQLEGVNNQLLAAMRSLTPESATPRNFFLNEHHTTHVTKAQARRERAEAKKARENEGSPQRRGSDSGRRKSNRRSSSR